MPHMIVGVDPGIVDTGIVRYRIGKSDRLITVKPAVVTRATATEIANQVSVLGGVNRRVFIEGYRPRGHLATNQKMTTLVHEIKVACGPHAKVLPNTGIKSVVKPALLALLCSDAQRFSHIPTHHGDLVSAARIAILGMLKDPELNRVLADIVRDTLNNRPWTVEFQG